MNPQKLAGQCGKLKCCLNFETDAYAEASKQMPPRDAVLQTQDADFFQFKVDILARTVTYSTDKHLAVNLVTISASRALEIIELNKQGLKVEQLEAEKVKEEPPKEYVELVGQDSLTRFDRSGKSKKKRKAPKPEPKPQRSTESKEARQPRQQEPRQQKAPGQEPRQPKGNPQQKRQKPRRPNGQANQGNGGNTAPATAPGNGNNQARRPKRKPNPPKNENPKE